MAVSGGERPGFLGVGQEGRVNAGFLFLPVETIAREFDSKVLIAHRAMQQGYSVVIGSKGYVQQLALRWRSGAYLNKDHSPLSKETLADLHAASISLFALDEEGLVYHSDHEYTKRIDRDVIGMCKAVFVWGNAQHSVFMKTVPEYEHKLHVLGNPRFDLLHPQARQFLLDQTQRLPQQRFILINTNFAAGNWNPHLYGTPSYVEHQKSRGKIKTQADEDFYTGKVDYYTQLFAAYVEMVKAVSRVFPQLLFVVRPHPDEHHDRWREAVAGVPNVSVQYSGSAVYWMQASQGVVFTGCTTGIEAWALRKPTIRYNPLPGSDFEAELPNRFGTQVQTLDQLIAQLQIVDSRKYQTSFDVQCQMAQQHVANLLTHDAAERIVDLISKYRSESRQTLSSAHYATDIYLPQRLRNGLFHIRKVVGNLLAFVPSSRNRQRSARAQKFSEITQSDILARLNSLDCVYAPYTSQKYSFTTMAPSTFLIRLVLQRNPGQ